MFNGNGKPKKNIKVLQKKADCDRASLGSLLKAAGLISIEQLDDACKYQIENQDEMLGEILIKLGYISEEIFLTMMAKQRALKNGVDKKEMRMYFSIARRRTESVGKAHDDMRLAAMQLVQKLTKAEG